MDTLSTAPKETTAIKTGVLALSTILLVTSVFAVGCGPNAGSYNDDNGGLARTLSGVYTDIIPGFTGSHHPGSLSASYFDFQEDGGGRVYFVDCYGSESKGASIQWRVSETEPNGIEFTYVGQEGKSEAISILPGESNCGPFTGSVLSILNYELQAGQYCPSEFNDGGAEGMISCRFIACDEVSTACENATGEE